MIDIRQDAPYRNRIVGTGEEKTDQLLANPDNWRVHPMSQQEALAGVLSEIGWIQSIIVNRTTGHMIDGHLRAILADRAGQETVPVTYVELSSEEEALALATFDPLGALAVRDDEKLRRLLAEAKAGDERVGEMLQLLEKELSKGPRGPREAEVEDVPSAYEILVQCDDESQQADLLDRLMAEGFKCRALIS